MWSWAEIDTIYGFFCQPTPHLRRGTVGCAFDHWRQLRGVAENATLPDERALESTGRPFPQRKTVRSNGEPQHSLRTRADAMGCVESRRKTCQALHKC